MNIFIMMNAYALSNNICNFSPVESAFYRKLTLKVLMLYENNFMDNFLDSIDLHARRLPPAANFSLGTFNMKTLRPAPGRQLTLHS